MHGATRQGFLRQHRLPLAALLLLPFLANAPGLSGYFNIDPMFAFLGLDEGLRGGWVTGPMGWLDPSIGYITEPLGYLAAQDWLHGIVPWWNPYSGLGMPIAAETDVSAFFMPFALLLHFNGGWLLLRILLQMGCGVFGYLLFIEIGLTRAAACFGGALYALSPLFYLTDHAAGPLPFLPLLLLGIERTRTATLRGAPMGWSLVALAGAYLVYSGFPEIAFFEGLLAGLWVLWRLGGMPRRIWGQFAARLALATAIGAALSGPQILPFVEYLRVAFIGPHAGFFSLLRVPATLMPLQLLPFLYGPFGHANPASLFMPMGGGCVRVPGWVDLPVLAMALAAVARRGPHMALRRVLLGWVALWAARYAGVAPVMHLMNAIPGLAATDSTRFSGPAVDFAVFVLAAFAMDDWQRIGPLGWRQRGGIVALLGVLVLALVLPVRWFLRAWFALYPADVRLALGTGLFSLAVLGCWAVALGGNRWRRGLLLLLLAEPLGALALPQLAGFTAGRVDMAPIKFLQAHAGTDRMISLGPLDLNFPARFGIASVNYFSLPAPALWTDYVSKVLFPQAHPASDMSSYSGAQPGQAAALMAHLALYEGVGVRYVVTSAGDPPPWANAVALVDPSARNKAAVLAAGGVISGTFAAPAALAEIGGMSVTVGTFMGASRGPLTATLCAAQHCETAQADAGMAVDDAALTFMFPAPLAVPPGAVLSYRFAHPRGAAIALWLAPDAHRVETPTIRLIAAAQAGGPRLVFQDPLAAIYELPQAASYAQVSGGGCTLVIADRQTMRTACAAPGLLLRRELYFPGWRAVVNGVSMAVAQDGVFQTVAVPAGDSVVRFEFLPPGIGWACALALLAALVWAACGVWGMRARRHATMMQ